MDGFGPECHWNRQKCAAWGKKCLYMSRILYMAHHPSNPNCSSRRAKTPLGAKIHLPKLAFNMKNTLKVHVFKTMCVDDKYIHER